jgi:TPR repeat protein
LIALFRRTAAGGDLVAAFNLGVCLLKGVGIEKDEQQAAVWLRRAAEGVPEAQYTLGRLLSEGRGIAADLKAAREWFARAAEAGVTDSQVALAEMLINARGGAQDASAALRLCEQAAAKGHSGAMFALGAMPWRYCNQADEGLPKRGLPGRAAKIQDHGGFVSLYHRQRTQRVVRHHDTAGHDRHPRNSSRL